MKSWEVIVVVVVVIAMVGDGRDVVAIGTESDLMGSISSCDKMIEGNARIIIRFISIMSINNIIIIVIIIVCSEFVPFLVVGTTSMSETWMLDMSCTAQLSM
jgi:hypothetical protein